MTWTKNRQGIANTMERLDRALCNAEWRTMFPEATFRVLPRTYSGHSPLVIYTQAPGTDGIQAIFYHNYWSIVGKSVYVLVNACFRNKSVLESVIETLIVFIPKVRPLLDSLVSPNQSSFIPGRNTIDNIIITHEILHTLRHKKGNEGGMIFKIDLEKAYDKLSWDFIRDTLVEFNMNDNWINLIMSYVSNCKSTILWNREILEGIKNERRLRQDDPHLFVLSMERLSNMISSNVEGGQWKGIKATRTSPPISHLFFADDLILFAKAYLSNCDTIMSVLSKFCAVAGQKINHSKSKLFVFPNLARNKALSLSFYSDIPLTQNLGKYLGSPMIHGTVNRNMFRETLKKLKNRLSGWKARTFSLACRTTLIQYVTSAIPSYNMQTMEIPRRVCDEMDRLNCNFLWGDTDSRKKVHLVNWESVCISKAKGGLGIRKARDQNAALLTKLG
ncbi:uncharacterized protein LOC114260679 [Camellia sinensis]|uniref:uncharacterized protein LOC114260679 n=1 Tax=Camellia sinensis TaxID=4442 RepID=UPI001035CC1B|nr:uncharacterized protein LOC114260679 [Camellia sinensis]